MNLIKSTGTFGFFTLMSRILGYIRDILIAIFLGTGPLADAFFVAFRIPNTFRRLFSEGTFNAAFVPSYSSEITKGTKQSNDFANSIFNLLFLGLLFLVLLVQIFMPGFVSIIAPGFVGDFEKMNIAINLTRITFPFLFFISIASFFAAILNSHNKFAAASAAPPSSWPVRGYKMSYQCCGSKRSSAVRVPGARRTGQLYYSHLGNHF